jgi:hypothetical protein
METGRILANFGKNMLVKSADNVIVIIFVVGCASTQKMSDYERANKAMFYRTKNKREYIRLYGFCDSLRRCNDSLHGRPDQANRPLLITTYALITK